MPLSPLNMPFIAVKSYVLSGHASTKRHGPYVSVETTHTNYDILWSLWNNLAASHRDQSLASGHNYTFKPWSMKSVCVCVRESLSGCLYRCMSLSLCEQMHTHGWYSVQGLNLIQIVSQRWIIDHLLCGGESCWTAVSYVNGPFVQCSNQTNTFMRCIIQVFVRATVHKGLLNICKQLGDWNLPYFPHYRLIPTNKKLHY